MKKIFFIGWHNGTNIFNGPVNIFNNLTEGISKNSESCSIQIISPETFKGDSKRAINYIFKNIISGRDKIFVINGNGLKFPMLTLILSKLNRKHKYFLMSHGLRKIEDKYAKIENKNYHKAEGILIKNFDNIIAVSSLLKKQILNTYGRKKPIYVAHSGFDVKTISHEPKELKSDNIKIILSGGLKRIKGVFDTEEIINYINTQNKPYKVFIDIYGGYDEEETLEHFKSLKINEEASYINYKGTLSKEKLMEAYKNYDLSIALSHSDTFNMAVLEGFCFGLPAIVSTNCGISEIMEDYKQGLIIDMSKDYKDKILEFIDKIYEDRELHKKMSEEALRLGKEQNVEKMVSNYLEVILGNAQFTIHNSQ